MDDAGTCAGIRPQLGVYLTGAIAPADRVVVVRHLTACASCRAELAGLAGLPALLRRPPVQAAAQEPHADNTAPDNTVTYYPDVAYPDTCYPDLGYPGADYPEAGHTGADYPGAGYPEAGRLVRRVARRGRRRGWLLAAVACALVVAAVAGWALRRFGSDGALASAEQASDLLDAIRDVS